MNDQQRFQASNVLIQHLIDLRERLPKGEQGQDRCSCDATSHCAHHSAVYCHLEDAAFAIQRAAAQLQYPNGQGDRPAF